jgi:hypothetical protein
MIAADFVHSGKPLVTCEHVGTEGLQKEFGHDRVRLHAAAAAAEPRSNADYALHWLYFCTVLQAYVVLNLTADLRSEFTWNTKQLFVFVNVLFETPTNAASEMVAWSSIVKDKVGSRGLQMHTHRDGHSTW